MLRPLSFGMLLMIGIHWGHDTAMHDVQFKYVQTSA